MPAWSAVIVQVPAPTSDTVEPLTVQMPALLDAAANETVRADEATAETVYVGPPTVAPPGGVELKLIVWFASAIVKDC